MDEPRLIPQRELRNNVAEVLRKVEAGERLRITVRGRPVADLVPVDEEPRRRQRLVPWEQVEEMFAQIEPDPTFMSDVDDLVDQTTDWPG